MPSAAMHSHYWAGSGEPPPATPATDTVHGYVPWQTTIIIGGGFGVTQVAWEWLISRVKERRDGNL